MGLAEERLSPEEIERQLRQARRNIEVLRGRMRLSPRARLSSIRQWETKIAYLELLRDGGDLGGEHE